MYGTQDLAASVNACKSSSAYPPRIDFTIEATKFGGYTSYPPSPLPEGAFLHSVTPVNAGVKGKRYMYTT